MEYDAVMNQLKICSEYFENNLKTGYVEITPLQYQKDGYKDIPGLYEYKGKPDEELQSYIAIARESLHELHDLFFDADSELFFDFRVNSWSGYTFLTLMDAVHDATVCSFYLSHSEYLHNYMTDYRKIDSEHEWDQMKQLRYAVKDTMFDSVSMVDPGTNGLYLLTRDLGINVKATCEGHPHAAYVFFELNCPNSYKLAQSFIENDNWILRNRGNSEIIFDMKPVADVEEKNTIWRQTWDKLKADMDYTCSELPEISVAPGM